MNGVAGSLLSPGWPAVAVVRLSPQAPVAPRVRMSAAGEEALLAAVRFPPRTGEVRAVGTLLPKVLARYGLQLPDKEAAGNSERAGAATG